MFRVFVKPSVQERSDFQVIPTIIIGSMVLDSLSQRIRRLLSRIEAALRDLDSLSSRSAAGEKRVAPSRFAVPPGAFCNCADHVVTS
jgi:hypothetical protein